jgi:hypothetical protein
MLTTTHLKLEQSQEYASAEGSPPKGSPSSLPAPKLVPFVTTFPSITKPLVKSSWIGRTLT